MFVVRFSAAEQRGLILPRPEAAVDIGELALLMVQAGIAPTVCEPGEITNLTPPYSQYTAYQYWLQAGEASPPTSAIVHLAPSVPESNQALYNADGTLSPTVVRSVRIPEEVDGVPLIAPTADRKALKVHELIARLPASAIDTFTLGALEMRGRR